MNKIDIFPNYSFLSKGIRFVFQSETPEANTACLAAEMDYLGKMSNEMSKSNAVPGLAKKLKYFYTQNPIAADV